MNKQELRKIYRSRREQLSLDDVERGSIRISNSFFKNMDASVLRCIHVFLPIKLKKEVNTWFLIEELKKKFPSVNLAIPKVVNDELISFLFETNVKLEENKWGIPEPVNAEVIDITKLDLVLIPLLVFDVSGNRIGYGKGHYDKFLATCRKDVIKVGLSFFEAEERIEAESFDIPLDFCITPEKFYSFVQ